MTDIEKAKELYNSGNYAEALFIYQKLGNVIGYKNFYANIKLCKNTLLKIGKTYPMVIVSLTSYGERVNSVHKTIGTLLNQTFTDYKIILWLSENEFPNKMCDLPNNLSLLCGKKFEIRWTYDIKSYKKLIPALKEFYNDIIITADDDIYYKEDWIEKLYKEHLKYREYIIVHRAHRIKMDDKNKILPYSQWKHRYRLYSASYRNFFTGCGGVLYPPKSLYKDVLREDIFLSAAPTADDLWFWAMSLMNKRKILIVQNPQTDLTYVEGTQDYENNPPLWHENARNGGNDHQFKNIEKLYPEIKNILVNDRHIEGNIVFISDINYVIPTVVAITSMLENKFLDSKYNITVILDNVNNEDIFKEIEKKYSVKINIINYNSSSMKVFHREGHKQCVASKAALIKFMLPYILKEKDKILYLDSDLLVQKDLSELMAIDIKDYPLAAVIDTRCLYSKSYYKYSKYYFNSGVIIMNLKEMRKHRYPERLIKTKNKITDNSLMDQNVFNLVFKDKFYKLPIKYNLLYTNLRRAHKKYTIDMLNVIDNTKYLCLDDALFDAYIVHFSSKDKPWKYTNVPMSDEWNNIYQLSLSNLLPIVRKFNHEWY